MPISELLKWKTIGATLNGSNASVRRCIEYGVERFFFDFFFFSVKKKARHFSNVKDYRKIDQIHHRNVLNNTFESANFFWENMPLKPNNNGFEYILNELFFYCYLFDMDFGNFGRFSIATFAVDRLSQMQLAFIFKAWTTQCMDESKIGRLSLFISASLVHLWLHIRLQKYFNPECRCLVFNVNHLWIDVCSQHYPCGRCNKWFRRTFKHVYTWAKFGS